MARYLGFVPLLLIAALVGWLLLSDVLTGANRKPPEPGAPAEKYAVDWDAKAEPVAFDAKRAMGYLKAVCDIGPRISGTEGMKKQQELLEKHFKEHGGAVSYQRFTARQRSQRKPVEMANLVVSYHPGRARRVIVCSHYDTRPLADQLKATAFDGKEFSKTPVEDDHVMLNKNGIPAVDLIDFDYKHWHRLTDVPENCSGDRLEQVGRVLGIWVQQVTGQAAALEK